MTRGISTNLSVVDASTCLSADIEFIMRYYSQHTQQSQKVMTPEEAGKIAAAALTMGVVYEDAPVDVGYFSNARGVADATYAFQYASTEIGQPSASAIYFSVDYDASADDVAGPIADYFAGIRDTLASLATVAFNYLIGVYGSGAVCHAIKEDIKIATFSWLAESTGWRDSKTYGTWDIQQAEATSPLCGLDVGEYEECAAQGAFGGFQLPVPPGGTAVEPVALDMDSLTEPAMCVYQGVSYSAGSTSCQNGLLYRCLDDGTWDLIGGPCDSSQQPLGT